MFAQIYTGCKCGETWRTEIVEECFFENDEVYQIRFCSICNTEVIGEKKETDGRLHYHALTESEIEAEMYSGEENEAN